MVSEGIINSPIIHGVLYIYIKIIRVIEVVRID